MNNAPTPSKPAAGKPVPGKPATRLAKLSHLTAWQWQVLLRTPFILLLTWFRLHSAGYRETLLRAQPRGPNDLTDGQQLALARETAYALAVSIKYAPWNPLCLCRSLTLAWFLGRRGVPFEVLIGVRNGQPAIDSAGKTDFSAHAWVEQAGNVLNDRENVRSQFSVFDTPPAALPPRRARK